MRDPQYTRERYSAMLHYVGHILTIIGVILVSPLLCLIFYTNEAPFAWGFIFPGMVVFFSGALLTKWFSGQPSFVPSFQESCVLIVATWLSAVFIGAVPFVLTIHLNLHQAVFESTSGWTTTGLSVVNPDKTPNVVLLYRSILQYAGGAGFVIMVLSILEGPIGRPFAVSEGREEQLVPNIKHSARLVIIIYFIYTLIGILFLRIAGMNWFDAVNHSFSAISTGGFSTKAQSIGHWNSPAIVAVIIFLMLLGSLNFLTAYMIYRGRLRVAAKNPEFRFLCGCLGIFLLISFWEGLNCRDMVFNGTFRIKFFDLVSALTTTGFSISDTTHCSSLYAFVLTALMVVGGGTGSTAGGMKQFRVYILLRTLVWEFKRCIAPDNLISEISFWQGEQRQFMNDAQIRQVCLFILLYLVVLISGSLLLCSHGYSLEDSLFEYASSLSTVGLSSGITSPGTPSGVLWCQIFGMLLGRLEFYAVIIGCIKLFRDIRILSP